MKTLLTALSILFSMWGNVSFAETQEQTFFHFTSGNGHSAVVYNSKSGRLLGVLDHPYRYLRPRADPKKDGIERRNLMESFKLGLGSGDSIQWLEDLPADTQQASYLDESNVIQVQARQANRIYFSPFGLEHNSFVTILHANEKKAERLFATASLSFHLGANPVSSTFWQPRFEVIKIPGEKLTRLVHSPEYDRQIWIEQGQGLGAIVYIPLQSVNHLIHLNHQAANEISNHHHKDLH